MTEHCETITYKFYWTNLRYLSKKRPLQLTVIFWNLGSIHWRYLWTLPGRKQCTRSSSFPSTIIIPNFKSISPTVLEFWKRYHQSLHDCTRPCHLMCDDDLRNSTFALFLKFLQIFRYSYPWFFSIFSSPRHHLSPLLVFKGLANLARLWLNR